MPETIDRMQFLTGDLQGHRLPIRPPWAIDEAQFTDRCTRCGDCIEACSYDLIREGRGRFPRMDFSLYGCDFCGDCVDACKPDALYRDRQEDTLPWNLKATIQSECLSLNGIVCRACGEACEPRALTLKLELRGVARPLLELGLCTGCGECYAVCPIKSVRISPVESRDQAA